MVCSCFVLVSVKWVIVVVGTESLLYLLGFFLEVEVGQQAREDVELVAC